MIRLRNLHKSYVVGRNRLHVLKGIDLDIGRGELVSVMGASGSGKSTLMNIIGLLDRFDEGDYRLDGADMSRLSETQAAQYRSRSIGFVFQSFHLIPFKTAAQNVALPLYYQGVARRDRNRVAEGYLAKVGLAERASHLPSELSGGEQQRVAIARALVAQPKVLLADEPTGALDSATSFEVMKVLQGVQAEGVTVVIITHEHDVAHMTDRVVQLVDGRVAGDHPQQRRNPEVAAAETLPAPAVAGGPLAGSLAGPRSRSAPGALSGSLSGSGSAP